MKVSLQILLLALCALGAFARIKTDDFTSEERWEATLQGIKEAKDYVQSLEKTAKAESTSSSSNSAATMLKKFFRKASAKSIAMGKARLHIEEAVKKAERILMEKKRLEVAKTSNKIDQAEVIAQELYHKPGTLLDKKEIAHIYQESDCSELREEPVCSSVAFYHSVRTISGICNNIEHPTQGSSFTPFGRLIQGVYENGIDSLFNQADLPHADAFNGPSPSARFVSNTAIRDREINSSTLTHVVMQWGQFMDHDLDLAVEFTDLGCDLKACTQTGNCAPVRVAGDDQEFGQGTVNNGVCLAFQRTVPACPENPFEIGPREQVNELTHYIDGSMVYGSTDARAKFLREFQGGRLRVSEGDNLPRQQLEEDLFTEQFCAPVEEGNGHIEMPETCCPDGDGFDQNGCFVAGDIRAIEHVSLTVMHTIWVREHNRIAAGLSRVNPQWDDDRLYEETRKIVIAEIEHIHFFEYLPALYGPTLLDFIPPYTGYNPLVDASIPNSFATAAYRFGHSQIQPFFERLDASFESIPEGALFLRDSFFSAFEFENGGGVTPVARGLLHQPARSIDEFLNSVLTSQLFEPINNPGAGMDLATLNIQRGRDHGLPRYGIWRRFCEDIFGVTSEIRNDLTKIRLLQMYGTLDQADLFVAALAEEPLPGSTLGATLSCIFGITFKNVRDGDRFWYENQAPDLELFTPEQLAEIKTVTLSNIFCDNAGLDEVQPKAFLQADTQNNRLDFCDSGLTNFNLWREDDMCYFRVSISMGDEETSWIFGQRPSGTGSRFVRQSNPATDEGTTIMCAAFNCPNSTFNTDIATSVEVRRRADCNILPLGSTTSRVRSAEVSPSTLQTAGNGIFGSLSECEASNEFFVQYSCDGVLPPDQSTSAKKMSSQVELEQELAKILGEDSHKSAKGQTETEPTMEIISDTEPSDLNNPNLDPELVDLFTDGTPPPSKVLAQHNFGHNAHKMADDNDDTSSSKKSETETLIGLLQATLKELKHQS